MHRFIQNDADVRAVCDVDEKNLARGRDVAGGNPKPFHDFRKLLELKDVDACAHWDAQNERITNHSELNSWLHRDYREPWRLEI